MTAASEAGLSSHSVTRTVLADGDDVGHHDLGVVAERLGEGPLGLGLEGVVELLVGAGLQLGDQRLDVDARARAAPMVRASRASWRRSQRSASPAPGYCTLTATSRPSCQRPWCTWPIDAAAVGAAVEPDQLVAPVRRRGRAPRSGRARSGSASAARSPAAG